MSDIGDKDQKSEAPTAKRLEDARAQGNRLRSRDVAILSVTVAIFMGCEIGWRGGWGLTELYSRSILSIAHLDMKQDTDFLYLIAGIFSKLFFVLVLALALLIVTHAFVGGFGLHWEQIQPRFERLWRISSGGGKFPADMAVDSLRAILRLTGYAAVFTLCCVSTLPILLVHSHSLTSRVASLHDFLVQAVAGLCLIAFLLLAIDIPVEWLRWQRKLRMSRQDIRQEMKDSEGSPEVRGAQRRRQREMLRRAIKPAVAQADMVVVNPVHYAVILRYDPARDMAPLVLAKGRGVMARAIISVAQELAKPVVRVPELSRALYYSSPIGQPICADLYVAAATIMAFLARVGASYQQEELPYIEIPDHLRFDAEGNKI